MHREQLAAERMRDPLVVVEEHVEREVDAGRARDRPDRVVDRVAFDHTPRRARIPMRRALWSARVVESPARPGATIFGPPLKPAKKCGSTKPVVIRISASTQGRCERDRHVVDRAQADERSWSRAS